MQNKSLVVLCSTRLEIVMQRAGLAITWHVSIRHQTCSFGNQTSDNGWIDIRRVEMEPAGPQPSRHIGIQGFMVLTCWHVARKLRSPRQRDVSALDACSVHLLTEPRYLTGVLHSQKHRVMLPTDNSMFIYVCAGARVCVCVCFRKILRESLIGLSEVCRSNDFHFLFSNLQCNEIVKKNIYLILYFLPKKPNRSSSRLSEILSDFLTETLLNSGHVNRENNNPILNTSATFEQTTFYDQIVKSSFVECNI